jgi:PEGA domain
VSRPVPVLAVVACALALAMSPGRALAGPSEAEVEEARTHYKHGVKLYEEGAYEAARTELERAYQLAPTYKLLYNLALVQMKLGDFAGARSSFRGYVDAAGAEIPPARRAEVDRSLAELEARVASLEITTSVGGVDITIDDRPVGSTPLPAPVRLNAGLHRLVASKEGLTTERREIELMNGDRAHVTLQLVDVPVAPPPVAPEPPVPVPPPSTLLVPPPPPPSVLVLPPPPPAPSARPTRWIGWTTTGVLAVGAIATGSVALVESSKLRSEVDTATPGSAIHGTHDAAVALALASDVLTGGALVAGGLTLYWTLSPKRADGGPPPHAGLLGLRLGPGTVGLDGTY